MIFLYMLIADVSLLARRRRRFEFSLQHFLNFHAQNEILSLESDSLKKHFYDTIDTMTQLDGRLVGWSVLHLSGIIS